ncbi:hypothetical protein KFL_002170140 [Klebsormidium nitens]|uniref:Uncharacterized protein n=1 Tax=Klebsormidium nitens TaxID=105231 RepID=A0A1Y1I266_KLENI|nr:hypothetical protein KFL_002170140 [Klebsormidium nitens]|eukprot:GAQ85020.1 hypothetical protein KFL_002170140 [Klebsormidium nitens]
MVPFPPDSQSKSTRSTPRKHRHSSASERSTEGESVQKRSLSFLNLNDQSFRNLAQQIAEEIIVRGPKEASSWGSVKESTGGGLSVSSNARDQGALLSTAKSTMTAGAATAGAPRRRLQEALQEAGLRSLAEKLRLEATHDSSTGPLSAARAPEGSASRPSPARAQRSRTSSPTRGEDLSGRKLMLEEKLGAPEMTRADLEQELRAERERREAEVAEVRKEAAERAKKLQKHVRRAEEEKNALLDRVSAASTDRADAQRALIGASEEVSVLTTEHQRAVAEAQRLATENEALRRDRRAVQDLERELERARAGSRDARELERELELARSQNGKLERENGRLVAELAAVGARQGDQAAKLALFEAQMREHRERVLAAERVMDGFRQGSGEEEKEKALERVKLLEAENAAKQGRVEELERQLLEGEGEETALQERLERVESELEGLRKENERLAGGGGMDGKVVGVLEETLRTVEKERDRGVAESSERERAWREGNAKRQERMKELERELAEAQEEIQAGEGKLLASARKESQMRVELREARERHAELATRVEGLEFQLKASKVDEGRAAVRAEKALKELERERRHVAELTSRLTSAGEEREAYHMVKVDMLAEIENGKARVGELEREFKAARAAAEEAEERLGADVREREAKIERLRGSDTSLKAELAATVLAHQEGEREAEMLRKSVTEARGEVERLTAVLGESEARTAALEESEKVLRERVLVAEEDLEGGRLREEGLTEQVFELETKARESEQAEKGALEELAAAENEKERLKGVIQGLEKEMEETKGELERLRWSEEEARSLLEMGGAAQIETAERANAAEARTAALAERLRGCESARAECETARGELEATVEVMELERGAKVAENEERVAMLIGRVEEVEGTLSECRESLRASGEEKTALEEHSRGLTERLAETRAEFERLVGEVERKRNEDAESMRAALASAEARAEVAEEEVARLGARVRVLEAGLAQANEALLRSGEEAGVLEEEVLGLRSEVEKLAGGLARERKECEALRTRVGDLEQELLEREGQLSILRSQGDADYYITPHKERRGGRF